MQIQSIVGISTCAVVPLDCNHVSPDLQWLDLFFFMMHLSHKMYNTAHETDSSTHDLCLMWQTMHSWATKVKMIQLRSYCSENVYPLFLYFSDCSLKFIMKTC